MYHSTTSFSFYTDGGRLIHIPATPFILTARSRTTPWVVQGDPVFTSGRALPHPRRPCHGEDPAEDDEAAYQAQGARTTGRRAGFQRVLQLAGTCQDVAVVGRLEPFAIHYDGFQRDGTIRGRGAGPEDLRPRVVEVGAVYEVESNAWDLSQRGSTPSRRHRVGLEGVEPYFLQGDAASVDSDQGMPEGDCEQGNDAHGVRGLCGWSVRTLLGRTFLERLPLRQPFQERSDLGNP